MEWAQLGEALRSVDWLILTLAAGSFSLNMFVKGLRWRILLRPLGEVNTNDAFGYLNIGNMANNLLPLRLGEVIRAVLLGEKKNFSKSSVLATIVVERLIDILFVVFLALILMFMMPVPALIKQATLAAGVIGSLGIFGLWWTAGRRWPDWLGDRLNRWLPRRTMETLKRLGHAFVAGMVALRSPKQVGLTLAYSVLAWGLVAICFWLVLHACQLNLPWVAAFMVLVLVNLGVAIPSAPGSIGVVHYMAIVALKPWMVEQSAAQGFSIVLHAMPYLVTMVFGVVYLMREGIGLGRVTKI